MSGGYTTFQGSDGNPTYVNPKNPLPIQQTGSNVKDYWTVTGVKTFASARSGLLVSNDGAADVTVAVNGMTFTLKSTEVLDENFDPFTTVTITAGSSAFRAWARG